MLNVKKLLTKILEALEPPTTLNMTVDSGYYQAIRSPGTGMAIYITLPKTPATITSNDLQLYIDGQGWVSTSIAGFAMRGMTCVIRLNIPAGSFTANAYGLQGTLNLTY